MAFGKKPGAPKPAQAASQPDSAPQQRQVAANDVAQRIIPEELFDASTPVGRMLKEIGFAPNDESNVVLTPEALQERVERERHMMASFIGNINSDLPDGVNVVPLLMIPEECWSGPSYGFLVSVLNVSPHGEWNVLPLPKDAHSATTLQLNLHPGNAPANLITNASEFISNLVTETQRAGEPIARQMAQGETPDFELATRAQDDARRKLRGLAFYIAGQRVGVETRGRSREMFFGEKDGLGTASHAQGNA